MGGRRYTWGMTKLWVALALAVVLGVPFLLRPASKAEAAASRKLVILTPHVPQIRYEFERAFARWHEREFGERVAIDWRVPGGTSEIVKQLQAVYAAELGAAIARVAGSDPARLAAPDPKWELEIRPGSLAFDMMFGGGSFDHARLKDPRQVSTLYRPFPGGGREPVTVASVEEKLEGNAGLAVVHVRAEVRGVAYRLRVPGEAIAGGVAALLPLSAGEPRVSVEVDLSRVQREASVRMSISAGFTQGELDAWYGTNAIGAEFLYDPGDEAKNDPGQFWMGTALSSFGVVYSKDVYARLGVPEPTSFEDLCRPELVGMVALADPRQSGSVTTTLDAILSYYGWEKGWRIVREMSANTRYFTNSAPKPPIDVSQGEAAAGLAIDFYGRGQSQATLAPGEDPSSARVGYVDPAGSVYIDADPVTMLRGGREPELARRFIRFVLSEEGQALWQYPLASSPGAMGPERYELRRLPVRPMMYEPERFARFVDKVKPFEIASQVKRRNWREAISVMMGSFAIDIADEQRAAWRALLAARKHAGLPAATLAEMEGLFYAFPEHMMPDGRRLAFNEANIKAIAASWKDKEFLARSILDYTRFFRGNYARIVALGERARGAPVAGAPGR